MVKATKLILAAALFAGSCTIAMAQRAGAAGGSKQVQNPAAPVAQGAETGTARDTAGPGANVKAPGSGNTAQGKMKTRDTNMPAGTNNSTGNMNTKGTGKGTTGTGGTGGSGNR